MQTGVAVTGDEPEIGVPKARLAAEQQAGAHELALAIVRGAARLERGGDDAGQLRLRLGGGHGCNGRRAGELSSQATT